MSTSVMVGQELPDIGDSGSDWRDFALCAQVDPELFFPEKGGSTLDAKRVCARCWVQADCLAYALEANEQWGIWGGLSDRERRKLKRRPA